jgi:DNA-binding NarL/FixJ family response regulator
VEVLAVIEDEPDVRDLVRITLELDADFEVVGEAASIPEAIELLQHAPASKVGLIILDHSLIGETTGLQGAPTLKALAPQAKIILFTAHDHLRDEANAEEAIDAFLLKTEIGQLLPLARDLIGAA